MTVVGSTFSNNEAALGSAVFNYLGGRTGDRVGGPLMVCNSTFSVNVAWSYGGGLYKQIGHDSPSLVSVEGSAFANNSAARTGGGLYHRSSSPFSSG